MHAHLWYTIPYYRLRYYHYYHISITVFVLLFMTYGGGPGDNVLSNGQPAIQPGP